MLNLPGSSIVPALSSPKQRLHKGHGQCGRVRRPNGAGLMKVARVCLVSRLSGLLESCLTPRHSSATRLNGGSSTAVAQGACQIMLSYPRELI